MQPIDKTVSRAGVSASVIASFWLGLTAGGHAFGQLPSAELSSIFPPGGKQGTTVEVRVSGNDLDDLRELRFSHQGITARPKMNPHDGILSEPAPVEGVFVVEISPDVPLGVHGARVVGRFGVSNPRSFAVNDLDELLDDGANRSAEGAREVSVGDVVSGIVDGAGGDFFRIELEAGQTVLFDCLAQRIDSRLDATMVFHDPSGREIARRRGGIDRDPVFALTAPTAGTYTLALRDFLYGGGGDYFYRLRIHQRPHIDFVLPPSGTVGSAGNFTLYGRNLPGGKPAEGMRSRGDTLQRLDVSIDLPPSADHIVGEYPRPRTALLDAIPYRLEHSNPILIGLSTVPVVLESDSNDSPEEAQTVSAPCEYAGQFYPARDVDWVRFEAKRGQVYRLEVLSHQLGLETDAYMIVQRVTTDDDGKQSVSEVAQVDDPGDRNNRIGDEFDMSTDDPSYRLVVDRDATYRVGLRDQFGSTIDDPRRVYRLAIRPESPDFRLVAVPKLGKVANGNQVPSVSPVIRQGGTALFEIEADRRDGFDGEISVAVEGLPDGVVCHGAEIGSGSDRTWLVLMADRNASAWNGDVKIVGRARIGDQDVQREARSGGVVWATNNKSQQPPVFRETRAVTLSVVEDESDPIQVNVGDGNLLETSLGGKLDVPVTVDRRYDFKGDVKLVATGAPGEIKPGDVTIKGDKNEGRLDLSITNNKAQPGVYTFYCVTDVKFKYPRNQQAVERAERHQKELADAVERLKDELSQATTRRDQAKQALEQSQQQPETESQQAAREAMEVAEQALADAQEKSKRAEELKKQADQRLDNLKKANSPKDITTPVVSSPIRLRIHSTPWNGSAADELIVKQGEKTELSATVNRRFGFEDEVEVSLEMPDGLKGIQATGGKIAKGDADARLELTASNDAPVGRHVATLRFKSKFNNVAVEDSRTVTLNVESQP